jgi:ferritin-like metal-binding protein YciE
MEMSDRTFQEQITKYLGDAHAIEEQALPQVKAGPKIARDPVIADAFERHIGETEDQKRRIEERLEGLGSAPNKVKDVAGTLSGPAFVLFAKVQPDTPGKLVSHAYSYEHMELAAYELLSRVARRANDDETAALARSIASQERDMANRLEEWDRVVDAALEAVDADDLDVQLNKYLADAHSIEAQALQMLAVAPRIAGDEELERTYSEHHEETKTQQERIEARLEARDADRNLVKDVIMRLGAINWGTFFAAQPDTPVKLAGFAYAFEHLEISAYEQLRRVADRAGDQSTVQAVDAILAEERDAAQRLWNGFDRALDASLDKLGVAA